MENLEVLRNWIVIFGAIAAVYFGLRELRQWRTEIVGRDKYGIVRRMGQKFLELADCIHGVRAIQTHTKPLIDVDLLWTSDKKSARLEEADHIMAELNVLNLEAKLFELDFEDELGKLRSQIARLKLANTDYFLAHQLHIRNPEIYKLPDLEESRERLFGGPADKFGTEVQNVVNAAVARIIGIMHGRERKVF